MKEAIDNLISDWSKNFVLYLNWMRDKTADFRVGQNSRFWKRDKIADFENGTKSPILKTGQTIFTYKLVNRYSIRHPCNDYNSSSMTTIFWKWSKGSLNVSIKFVCSLSGGQDKTADFKWDKTADFENETKPPISKMRQNRRFRKWDKTADFENETKPPILKDRLPPLRMRDKTDFENETKPPISKMRQNRRFRKWDKTADFKGSAAPTYKQLQTNLIETFNEPFDHFQKIVVIEELL